MAITRCKYYTIFTVFSIIRSLQWLLLGCLLCCCCCCCCCFCFRFSFFFWSEQIPDAAETCPFFIQLKMLEDCISETWLTASSTRLIPINFTRKSSFLAVFLSTFTPFFKQKTINIPRYSDSHCHFCAAWYHLQWNGAFSCVTILCLVCYKSALPNSKKWVVASWSISGVQRVLETLFNAV